ncbi:hypothetical protein JCM13304A_24050 [Desulfothermus okinawensis JCM 13304]
MLGNTNSLEVSGRAWDELDIQNLPSVKLQYRICPKPEHVFFFGAGASYGSDGKHLLEKGKLPPLGKDLFNALYKDPELKYWNKLPQEVVSLFKENTFEEAMETLDDSTEWNKESFRRDLDLVRYFSRFRPLSSNLYWKLAKAISRALKRTKWTGAAITLNYERLLEESFMRNYVFTVVKGVTFYDDHLPSFGDDQLFELCYPHGACQFFLGQNWFKGEGNIVFGKNARMVQKAGVNHILKHQNILKACDMLQIPMICRYQLSKRPTVINYFITTQQNRCSELILNAKHVTIIGVFCSHKVDRHLWEPLHTTDAFITYVNISKDSQDLFREWAESHGKVENKHYQIIPQTFKDAFNKIIKINNLV